MENQLKIIGGGLAGCEAAWQAAKRGVHVLHYEMRPNTTTGAHKSSYLAELVCSNSLGSMLQDRASGILNNELRLLDSLLLTCAEKTVVPAGDALAVDRDAFGQLVTYEIERNPNIELIRDEVVKIPDGNVIIATGPLTSRKFSESIKNFIGENHLYFYDAVAPLIYSDSVDFNIAFRGSRRHTESELLGDYINCPFSETEYNAFVDALVTAERIEIKEFEKEIEMGVKAGESKFFEGCLPIEIIAQRGRMSLAYGPMRPIGLTNPSTGKRPYAVVQLRQDNIAGSIYNLVGFQTNLKITEQKRVFRMIPGLQNVEFARYGQMHRNTFIFSPGHLLPTLQSKKRGNVYFAGQIIGIEGYLGNIATGALAGINSARQIYEQAPVILPRSTMLGALCHYITHASGEEFQPMKANLGILSALEGKKIIKGRKQRGMMYFKRSEEVMKEYIEV